MKVEQVMNHPVHVVAPEDNLVSAARLMRVHDVGFLPVVAAQRVVGVVTDRDLAIRAMAEGSDAGSTQVGQVMTAEVFHCFSDEELSVANEEMERRGVRRLVVFDRKMHLAGVLTLEDLTVVPGDSSKVGQTLRHLSG